MESLIPQTVTVPSRLFIRFAQWASFGVISLGGLVLLGWTLDNSTLKRILPGLVAMNPATAVSFICSGISLRMLCRPSVSPQTRRIAQAFSIIVVAIAGMKLLAYKFGLDRGVDLLLFYKQLANDIFPNRMAPNTAFGFLLIGVALTVLDVETPSGRRPAQWLAVGTLILAMLTLVGYAFYVSSFRQVASYIPMALHTAVGFALISSGVLCARPGHGIMALLSTTAVGGQIARRILPFAVAIPLLFGWLGLQGQYLGLYGTEFGLALMVLANVIVFTGLIWWNAKSLNQADSERQQREAIEREKVRLERFLVERQQIEQMKDGLLDIISHELRTPISAVQEGVSQLADGILGPMNADQQNAIAITSQNVERLKGLVEKALLATQLLMGRVKYVFQSVDIAELLSKLRETYGPLAELRGVRFEINQGRSSLSCIGDARWLYQAVGQLVENAIQVSAPDEVVTVSCLEESQELVIVIQDTGPGIPESVRPLLFDRFLSVGGIYERKTGGLGLGLFIAKRVIQDHDGMIIPEDSQNRGTRIIVRIRRHMSAPNHG